MSLLLKTCILLTLLQLASTQKYLFESAKVSFKRVHEKPVKNREIKKLTAIDQHFFHDAENIKIRTRKMDMYEGAVKNLPNLKVLRLKNCGIQLLEPKAFLNLPKIEKVHMQENDLTAIVNDVFNYLPISELWLQRNEITTIDSGAFDNMPNLEIIRLSGNMLSKWDSGWFANTPKLTTLYFRANEFTELPPRAFVNIKPSHKVNGSELVDTQIFLTSNNISYLHPESLHGIDSLHELSLRNNNLKHIDWKMFSHMSELHRLSLAKNSLSKIESDAFEKINEIQVLNLSKNSFECIPYGIVSKVKEVILKGKKTITCPCLHNLIERLREEKLENKINIGSATCAND